MRQKVLIVEDELLVAEDLREQLSSWGMEIVGIARSGEEALKLIAYKTPDIILMDMKSNGKNNGMRDAQSLRTLLPRTQFIFISGLTEQQVNSFSDEIWFRFVKKPIDPDELNSVMAQQTDGTGISGQE